MSTNCGIFATPATLKLTDQFTTVDGLSINGVNALCRDRRGYLWIATYDGLNRYNGHSFTIYNKQNSPNGFNNNRVRALTEFTNGDIWIGTDDGISLFDYATNQFDILSLDGVKRKDINCIVKKIFVSHDQNELYCITENDGILIYGKDRKFKRQQQCITDGICNDAMMLDADIILLATTKGIEYHNLKSGKTKCILDDGIPITNYILKLNPNSLLVALGKGLYKIDIRKDKNDNTEYIFEIASELLYPQNMFKTLALGDDNTLWLGTKTDGVRLLDLNKLGEDKSLISYLRKDRISTFLFEEDGVKWVASFDNGVYRYDNTPNQFNSIGSTKLEDIYKIYQIVSYDEERILLRSILNKLLLYNIYNDTIDPLPFDVTTTELTNIRCISRDDSGQIWIFINYGEVSHFVTIDTKTDRVRRIYSDDLPKIATYNGYISTFDENGDIWISTQYDIYRISLTSDQQIKSVESLSTNPYFESHSMHASRILYCDVNKNLMWIGSNTDGLFRLDIDRGKPLSEIDISHYTHDSANPESLSSNTISAIHRTADGTLWIGTEQGGLCRVFESGSDLKFKQYSQREGLSNHVVKGILSDHNNDLWIATNIGLNHFSPQRDERFTIYRIADGIPFENFHYSCLQLHNGRMVFSGGNNLIHFNPVDLPNKEENPNMWFSSLSINNNRIETDELVDGRAILTKALSNGDVIELRHDENIISIGVDVLSRASSNNYKVEYKLEPLSSRWTSTLSSSNQIQFEGLQPDTYTLSVRCSNFYGIWSDTQKLTIKIAPPLWKTTGAYILYALILFIVISIGIYIILHIWSLRHQLQIELISKRNLENLNREKQRYFSNISHELKTPLTLILAPIAVLTDKFKLDVSVTNSLQVINRQSKKMLQLIDLAHNIQLESDKLLVKKSTIFDFNKFVVELTADFKYYAESDKKILNILPFEGDVIVEADQNLIEKILNNLLSNAFKHTRQQDSITLSYRVEQSMLTLTVEDSGYGIDEADLPRIFERFYQAKRRGGANIGGTGIGLTFSQIIAKLHDGEIDVESKFGVGTKFTVRLPIVVDTSLFDYEESVEAEVAPTVEDIESALILGDMNIDSITVREDLRDSTVYLVEDNLDMRLFLEGIISQFYNVKSFSNGVECLEAMQSAWPDIVLSDVMMPQMDGYELCSSIKNNTLTSHIPVILLTACSTIDQKIKGLSCGADSYIPKPFYPKHTITRIDALLYNRKKLRERFLIDESIIKGPNNGNKDSEFMNNLYKIFADNLSNEEIDIDNIATELCVSRTLFFQKVKAITNDSPYELLKNYRLKRASEYLSMGDVQVNEVSFLVGFKSRTHFSKLFKDKYGHTPGQYAKLAKKGEL
ncbi:MAG: ATP-binding protein [Rikenellaceae bacterium]